MWWIWIAEGIQRPIDERIPRLAGKPVASEPCSADSYSCCHKGSGCGRRPSDRGQTRSNPWNRWNNLREILHYIFPGKSVRVAVSQRIVSNIRININSTRKTNRVFVNESSKLWVIPSRTVVH